MAPPPLASPQMRQWSPDERAAWPDLTGNTLRMRLDEVAATPGVEGTSDPGVEVEVVVNSTALGRTTADAKGRWSDTVTSEQALPVGSHRLVAYAVGVTQARSEPSTEVDFGIQSRALEVTGWGCGSSGGSREAVGLAWLALLALVLVPSRMRREVRAGQTSRR